MFIRNANAVLNRLGWIGRLLHGATCGAVSPARNRQLAGRSFVSRDSWSGLEPLQSRVLLSANLVGTIDTSKPARCYRARRHAERPHPSHEHRRWPRTGKITINLSLSGDQTLDAGTDLVVASLTNQRVNLKPGQAPQTFMAKLTVPSTRPAGSYFFLADIDPGHVASLIDNVASSPGPATLAYEFGNFSGRTNVKLVVGDESGKRSGC